MTHYHILISRELAMRKNILSNLLWLG